MNAAPAIVAGEKAADIREGIKMAEACIDDGRAMAKLEALIEMSNA